MMRIANELIGLVLFIAACIWVGIIFFAPAGQKPGLACQPAVALVHGVRDAIVAAAPGGALAPTLDSLGTRVERGCHTYAGNLFEVIRH